VGLIILPLGERPLAMAGVFLFIDKFVEDFDGLFIRNNAFTEKLVFSLAEADHVVI